MNCSTDDASSSGCACFPTKCKHVQIPLRVADHALVIAELKEADVAVVILDALLLQLAHFVGRKHVGFALLFRALARS